MNRFNQIESDIDVSKIKHKGDCIWPIIKSYLITLEPSKANMLKTTNSSVIVLLLKSLILDIFSIFNLFRSDTWVFTNSERRYAINNLYFDRVTSGLLNYFDKYAIFENPIPKGRSKRKVLQKGELLVGMSWIYLIQFIMIKMTRPPKIVGLNRLEEHLQTDLSKIKSIYHRYHIGYLFFNFLFKFRKPKAVFIVCYYTNYGLIKACKHNNIPVLEMQHGIVTAQHRAYNFSREYGTIFFPDYFLGYGDYFNGIVSNGNLVKKENTLNYGYSFLYEANKKLDRTRDLDRLSKEFNKVICFTGQLEDTDTKSIPFIYHVADQFPDIYFIYKPRNNNKVPFEEKKNLSKWEDVNTYLLLKYCDIHITVYSTCALESIALGTPSIAIDIDGLYTMHLKDIIHGNEFNYTVNDEKELITLLNDLKEGEIDRNAVVDSIKDIISPMRSKESFLEFFEEVVK